MFRDWISARPVPNYALTALGTSLKPFFIKKILIAPNFYNVNDPKGLINFYNRSLGELSEQYFLSLLIAATGQLPGRRYRYYYSRPDTVNIFRSKDTLVFIYANYTFIA